MGKKQEAEAEALRAAEADKASYRTLAADLLQQAGQRVEAGLESVIRSAKPVVQHGLDFGSGLVAGGDSTNRPPATSESQKREGRLASGSAEFAGGEDWFEASLWVQWDRWDQLRTALEVAREAAKTQAEGSDVNRADCVVIWNQEYLVHATGAAVGDGGRVYRYRLQKNGVTYLIANAEEPSAEFPNVRFVVGSLPLMLEDAETIWKRIQCDLDDLGGEIVKSTLSRVDVCVDLPNVDVSAFEERWRDGRYISRARDSEEFDPAGEAASVHWVGRGERRKCTGIRIGAKGAPIKLNVYDKLYEVTKKRDDAKLEALIKYRWGGTCPASATRVEVQMRREKIKEMTWTTRTKDAAGQVVETIHHVDSVDDWIKHRAEVIRYVLSKWLRFTEEFDFENNHHSDAETWDLWTRIRVAAETFFGGTQKAAGRVRKLRFSVSQLIAQSIGTISSAMVYTRGVILDKAEFVAEFLEEAVRAIDAKPWEEMQRRQCRKRSLFEARLPAHCFGGPGDAVA
jgi:hypothetical protein